MAQTLLTRLHSKTLSQNNKSALPGMVLIDTQHCPMSDVIIGFSTIQYQTKLGRLEPLVMVYLYTKKFVESTEISGVCY